MVAAAAYLKAIYDAPFDPAPRRAYATALKKGDPRAELIELQLGEGDPLRERALIVKHGKEWSGTLGSLFRDRVYRGGFFAGGTFKATTKPSFRDLAWRLVQVLARDWPPHRGPSVLELIEVPALAGVRGVYEIRSSEAAELATGARRPLAELGVHTPPTGDEVEALGSCPSLPDLTTLGMRLWDDTHVWLARAPVLRRVQRLIVDNDKGLGELVAACAKLGGPLREIVVSDDYKGPLCGAPGWRFRILRDAAPGPFTRVLGSYAPPKGGFPGFSLAPLGKLDPKTIQSIELVANKVKLMPDERSFATALLAPFARVRMPW
jgi:hypothetical protein